MSTEETGRFAELIERLYGKHFDCNCGARSSGECCCDTQWPENYTIHAAEALEQAQARIAELEAELAECKETCKDHGEIQQALCKQNTALALQVEQAQARIAELEAELARAYAKADSFEGRLALSEAELAELKPNPLCAKSCILSCKMEGAALALQVEQLREALEFACEYWCGPRSSELMRNALALSTQPAAEIIKAHDAKVIERCAEVAKVPNCRVVDRGFRWDSEALQHVPQLLIEFDPVPANSPNDSKGWKDRDALAAMLAAAPEHGDKNEKEVG